MSSLDPLIILSAVAVVYPAWKLVKDYLALNRNRQTIVESIILRKWVKDFYSAALCRAEIRNKVVRKIVISPSDLNHFEIVKKAYELLVQKDLSKDFVKAKIVIDMNYDQIIEHYSYAVEAKGEYKLWKLFNAGLLQSALSQRLSSIRPADEASSSILGLMLGKRMQAYTRAYGYLIASLCAGSILYMISNTEYSYMLGVTLPLVLICVLTINQKVLEYRINHGYFGNNASEAKEFIYFVYAHSDKSDFSDGDRMKKLMPDLQACPDNEVVVYGGEAIA